MHAVVTGFVVMALEMLGSRYLAPWFGASIHAWAALIATVLAALALGSLAGGRLADAHPRPALLGAVLAGAALWLALLPACADVLLSAAFALAEDVRVGSLLAAAGLFFAPCALLGAYTPFAIRIAAPRPERAGRVSGRLIGLATLGGILGTLLTPYVLIPLAGTRAITWGLAAATGAAALSFLLPARLRVPARRSRRRLLLRLLGAAPLMVGLSCWAIVAAAPVRAAPERFQPAALRAMPDGELAVLESPYATIYVRKRGRLLTLEFRRRGIPLIQSAMDLDHPDSLPAPYTRVLTAALLYTERPRRLLALGLGGGTTDRYLQRHVPGLAVQAVELDPGIVALAKRYFGVRERADYRIHEGDARVFLLRDATRYDIVILDAFRGDRIPAHLATLEFDRLVRAHLSPGGVLAVNLVPQAGLFAPMIATLRAAFPTVELYRAGEQWVVFAREAPAPPPEALMERARTLQARLHPPHDLRELVGLRRDVRSVPEAPVLTDDYAPIDVWRDPAPLRHDP